MSNPPSLPSDNEPTVMAAPAAQPMANPPAGEGGFVPEIPPGSEPPAKSKKTLWIVLIVAAVLLCCCCLAVVIIGLNQDWFGIDLDELLEGIGSLAPILV